MALLASGKRGRDEPGLADLPGSGQPFRRPAVLAVLAVLCLLGQGVLYKIQTTWREGSLFLHSSPAGAEVFIWIEDPTAAQPRYLGTTRSRTPGPLPLDPRRLKTGALPVELRLWGYEPLRVDIPKGTFLAVEGRPATNHYPSDGSTLALSPRVPVLVPLLYALRDWPFVALAGLLAALAALDLRTLRRRFRQEDRLRTQLELGDLGPGVRVGPYVLDAPIGEGGMARVFRAHRRGERDGEVLAVKILAQRFHDDPSYRERFRREADICRTLDHPHIVHILDWGEVSGHLYLVMEYVEGDSLARRLSKGPAPVSKALRWGLEVASALVYAQGRDIVHRDLKPANIMLTRSDRCVLMDFGIARRADFDPLTMGGVIGTPHYIAPEVIQGKPADWRADQYALGMTLYEAMAGRHPFEGSTVVDLLRRQVEEEPAPLRSQREDVPEEVARLVHRLLSKDPGARAGSPEEVRGQLERLLAG